MCPDVYPTEHECKVCVVGPKETVKDDKYSACDVDETSSKSKTTVICDNFSVLMSMDAYEKTKNSHIIAYYNSDTACIYVMPDVWEYVNNHFGEYSTNTNFDRVIESIARYTLLVKAARRTNTKGIPIECYAEMAVLQTVDFSTGEYGEQYINLAQLIKDIGMNVINKRTSDVEDYYFE
jgi:hypothetical protein